MKHKIYYRSEEQYRCPHRDSWLGMLGVGFGREMGHRSVARSRGRTWSSTMLLLLQNEGEDAGLWWRSSMFLLVRVGGRFALLNFGVGWRMLLWLRGGRCLSIRDWGRQSWYDIACCCLMVELWKRSLSCCRAPCSGCSVLWNMRFRVC